MRQLQGRAVRTVGGTTVDADGDAADNATVVSGSQTAMVTSSTWQDVLIPDGVDVLGTFLRCSRSLRPSLDESDELRTTLLQMSPLARRLTRSSDLFRALLSKGLEKVAKSAAMTAVLDLLCAGEVRLSRMLCARLPVVLTRCLVCGAACRAWRPSL